MDLCNFQVICGSMVGENCWSSVLTETPTFTLTSSLQLSCSWWRHCFTSSITVLILFFFMLYFLSIQVPHIFLSSLSLLYDEVEDVYVFPNFIYQFFHPSIPPGFQFLILISTSFKANHFSYINYNCFYQDICISNIFSSIML